MKPPNQGEFRTLSAPFEMVSSAIPNQVASKMRTAEGRTTGRESKMLVFNHLIASGNLASWILAVMCGC